SQRLEPDNVAQLTAYCVRVRQAVTDTGFREVDHVALFGPGTKPGASSRNFVLCPGGAYDRSPCGTGTSAKLACLAADGRLAPGEVWVQESILGSRFEASYRPAPEGGIFPVITGRAHLMAESTLFLDESDPFCWGIRTPLAAPGMVALGLKWMWNPESPFWVRPRLDADLCRWALLFSRAARPARVAEAAPLLRDLSLASKICFEALAARHGNVFALQKRG